MGSRHLGRESEKHARIAIDTAPLIYFLSKAEPWWPVVRELIAAATVTGRTLVVSAITEIELSVAPLRKTDERDLGDVNRLLSLRGVEVKAVSREIGRVAASLRAVHGLSLPDAVVAATATVEGCTALLGNDAAFRRVDAAWEYIHVDDFVT